MVILSYISMILIFFGIHLAVTTNNILIRHAGALITGKRTTKGDIEVLYNQDILIKDGLIEKIDKNITDPSVEKVLDATGKIVQPGFVDTHDHLLQIAIRGCGNHQDLYGWLSGCQFLQNDMTKEESFAATRSATYDLINTGVTTVMDWNPNFSENISYGGIDALKQSGLRYVYGFYPRIEKEFGRSARLFKEIVDKDPLGSFMISGHPNENVQNLIAKIVKLSEELNLTLNFHYGESVLDKHHEQAKIMAEANAYKRPLVLNHVIHVTEEEIKSMVNSRARVTYNPLSNMRLGSGIMPVGKLHNAGLLIGLGLDGGTNDNANFFTLMKVAVGLQRAKHETPNVYPDYKDILLMATIEGAKVLGLDEITGSIEINKSADLIIINPRSTNMGANFDTVAQIPLNAEPANVEIVMVKGRILKQNGEIVYSNESLDKLIETNKKAVERYMNIVHFPGK